MDTLKEIQKLKQKLKKLEESLTEFKVGDWIIWDKRDDKNGPYRLTQKNSGGFLDQSKIYRNVENSNYRYATEEEIKSHLIEEAKRRGFKIGTRFDSATGNTNDWKIGCIKPEYNKDNDGFLLDGESGCVYYQGKWAEIIKGVEVNGHGMEQDEDNVTFGCKSFGKHEIRVLFTGIEFFNKYSPMRITSIQLESNDSDAIKVDVSTLEEIVKEIT
jgi:hypothetical protein